MISLDTARSIIQSNVRLLEIEQVHLANASGRVLAEDAICDRDMPPFNNSAMDGFACRLEDCNSPLTVIETIQAGYLPKKTIRSGECARIMTGSVIPDGADFVVPFEDTDESGGKVLVLKKRRTPNIRFKGEDLKTGTTVLEKGTLLRHAQIATLAALGYDPVHVYAQPVVVILNTGDEIVEPSQTPANAQIRNSNGPQLRSQVSSTGSCVRYLGIVKDDPATLEKAITQAFTDADVVLVSGGVSMGDFDFIPDVLRKCGVTLHFETIAVKPGKPTVFGTGDECYFFGLPGNPVSTLILFEILVKPFLYNLMGHQFTPIPVFARLEASISRKKTDRQEFIPVQLVDGGKARVVEYHGSAHIQCFKDAHGIIALPEGCSGLEQDELVSIFLM